MRRSELMHRGVFQLLKHIHCKRWCHRLESEERLPWRRAWSWLGGLPLWQTRTDSRVHGNSWRAHRIVCFSSSLHLIGISHTSAGWSPLHHLIISETERDYVLFRDFPCNWIQSCVCGNLCLEHNDCATLHPFFFLVIVTPLSTLQTARLPFA